MDGPAAEKREHSSSSSSSRASSQDSMLDSLRKGLSSLSSSPDERKKFDSVLPEYYDASHHNDASHYTSSSCSSPHSSLTARFPDGSKSDNILSSHLPPPYDAQGQHEPSAPSIFCVDPRVISDATIGLSDGLTVPFALTAGLAALGSSRVVVFGGLAELMAGSISMGLGGYLGGKAESEAYRNLVSSTRGLVQRYPDHALELLRDSLAPLGIDTADLEESLRVRQGRGPAAASSGRTMLDEERLTQLLLRYVHSQPTGPPSSRAFYSGLTIALSYFCGGFVPLLPYLFIAQVSSAFWYSVALMVVSLAAFGAGKSLLLMGESHVMNLDLGKEDTALSKAHRASMRKARWRQSLAACSKGALQMILLGGIAACAAMGLVSVFDGGQGVE